MKLRRNRMGAIVDAETGRVPSTLGEYRRRPPGLSLCVGEGCGRPTRSHLLPATASPLSRLGAPLPARKWLCHRCWEALGPCPVCGGSPEAAPICGACDATGKALPGRAGDS